MARIIRRLLLSSRPLAFNCFNTELQSRIFRTGGVDLGMDCSRGIDSECGFWDGGVML